VSITPGQPAETAARTPAAVLAPFHLGPAGEPRLVLIERAAGGRHGGQIALPGGKRELTDRTMRDTAVRETCEELGLRPEDLRVLDELEPVRTRSTGFEVWPFVGRLPRPPAVWRPSPDEVASVLDVRVDELADPSVVGIEEMDFPAWNTRMRVPVRRVGGHIVWGLTLRILEPLLPRVLAGEYPL
jgi:8-oxo-dGTP pyrophosphatase MutT (NUDIX family)